MPEPLTRESVLSMPAGPEMDALVAEKVMGFELVIYQSREWWDEVGEPTMRHREQFRPSTDIAAAWEVLEKLAARMPAALQTWTIEETRRFACQFIPVPLRMFGAAAEAGSAPSAICRAALLTTLEDAR